MIPLLYAYAIKCVLIYWTYSYTCIQYTYNKIIYIACLIQFICHIYLTWICNCASIAHMFFLTPNVLCSYVFLWGREMLRQSILIERDGKSTKLCLNDVPLDAWHFWWHFLRLQLLSETWGKKRCHPQTKWPVLDSLCFWLVKLLILPTYSKLWVYGRYTYTTQHRLTQKRPKLEGYLTDSNRFNPIQPTSCWKVGNNPILPDTSHLEDHPT